MADPPDEVLHRGLPVGRPGYPRSPSGAPAARRGRGGAAAEPSVGGQGRGISMLDTLGILRRVGRRAVPPTGHGRAENPARLDSARGREEDRERERSRRHHRDVPADDPRSREEQIVRCAPGSPSASGTPAPSRRRSAGWARQARRRRGDRRPAHPEERQRAVHVMRKHRLAGGCSPRSTPFGRSPRRGRAGAVGGRSSGALRAAQPSRSRHAAASSRGWRSWAAPLPAVHGRRRRRRAAVHAAGGGNPSRASCGAWASGAVRARAAAAAARRGRRRGRR